MIYQLLRFASVWTCSNHTFSLSAIFFLQICLTLRDRAQQKHLASWVSQEQLLFGYLFILAPPKKLSDTIELGRHFKQNIVPEFVTKHLEVV